MIRLAKQEVLLLLPTVNAFLREQRLGIIQLLSWVKEGIKTKRDFEFRSPGEFGVTTVTIVVVDKKESLVFEKTDDSKENFAEALGLATYSDSKPNVMASRAYGGKWQYMNNLKPMTGCKTNSLISLVMRWKHQLSRF